jgi:hypothetical protein
LSVKKNLELLDKLSEIQEAIDDSLNVLDEQHQKIDLKTKLEVFSDEPVVRELLQDIAQARDSVLLTANILNESLNETTDTDEETSKA